MVTTPPVLLLVSQTHYGGDLSNSVSVIYKSELLSQMLGFYSTLEIITSGAMVCDILTSADVWACEVAALWDIIVITERPSARI